MHVPSKRREEFEEARYYEYPEHLRAAMADLPSCPGVYIFHGEDGDLPLYIGKSVNHGRLRRPTWVRRAHTLERRFA